MVNDKNLNFDEDELESKDSEFSGDKASRARNRTVMLSPEMTGEVRARFAKESEGDTKPQFAPPGSGLFQSSPNPDQPSKQLPPAAPEQAPTVGSKSLARGNEGAVWVKESPVVGFLVSFNPNPNGQIVELRSGRIIVTSEPASSGNFILLNDETVSPMHAILRITDEGEVQVLDQLSEYGTKIRRFGADEEEELSGEKSSIEHGDVISFGSRAFHVCTIARDEVLEADLDDEDEEL